MIQKVNRINKGWYWCWKYEKGDELIRFEKLKIEKYFEVLNHQGFVFILHKPTTPIGNWHEYMVTELKTGASVVLGKSLEEVKNNWQNWIKTADKKNILIGIAKATKKIKELEERWKKIQ